jgi:hypothetical protein
MRAVIIVACLSVVATPAFAWGQNGHRVTGAIAEQHLTSQARQQVRALLGVETLAEASTWADEMRSDPSPFWQSTANPYHYVTVPSGKTYAQAGAPPEGDAVTALTRFSATLRDPRASVADKQLALRFIVHIVGDLHQPLHAGNGTDRGGNDRKVTYRGEETNLHSVWDTGLIEAQNLSYSEMAAWLGSKITPEMVASWNSADPNVWIGESAAVRDQLYPTGDAISSRYAYEQLPTVKRRLQQAGVRIAAYLNAVYATDKRRTR